MTGIPSRARRGISLIEILMSIGVATIGVLGVASLIPVALHQTMQGTKRDRAAVVGQRALNEFRMRGMDNPLNWIEVMADGKVRSVSPLSDIPGPLSPAQPGQLMQPRFGPLTQAPFDIAVLDPIGAAFYGSTSNARAFASTVPADANAAYPASNRLRRFTIRAAPTGLGQATAMPLPHARAIFETQDDLLFEVSQNDNTSPAQMQFWGADSTQSAVVTWPNNLIKKRYAEGRYSWLATLVPERGSDQFILSTAVQYERILNLENGPGGLRAADERWASLPEGIVAGGARFEVDPKDPAALDNLKTGNWVLVVEQYLRPDNRPQKYARWYRVTQANHVEGSPVGEYSLDGPDWPRDQRTTGATRRVMAVIFKNVIDVYEKVIRLNSDGTWIEAGQL